MNANPCKVVVLISGNGSNLQALIDASKQAQFKVTAVISNKADAFGLQRAQAAAIPNQVIDHTQFDSRESFDSALLEAIEKYQPQLVVLAGFMRILSEQFVCHFSGRLINIHPSLLPKYPGMNTHQRALDGGDAIHGASVHFVTEELDGGPVIAHTIVPIRPGDDAQTLRSRVANEEHSLYPAVVHLIASGRVVLKKGQAVLDGTALQPGGLNLDSLRL
jgi:phosphoribosylglycinamide formyltransferase 1